MPKVIPVELLEKLTKNVLLPLSEAGASFVVVYDDVRETDTDVGAELKADTLAAPTVRAGGVLNWMLSRSRSGSTSIVIFNLPAGMIPAELGRPGEDDADEQSSADEADGVRKIYGRWHIVRSIPEDLGTVAALYAQKSSWGTREEALQARAEYLAKIENQKGGTA